MILQPSSIPNTGEGSGIARGERVAEKSVVGSVILHERAEGCRRKSPETWDVCLPAGGCQTPPRPSIRVLAGCERWSLSSHRHESSQAWPPRMRGFKGRPCSCRLGRRREHRRRRRRRDAWNGQTLLGVGVVYTGQRAGWDGSWEDGGEGTGALQGSDGGVKRGRGGRGGGKDGGWVGRKRERERG